MHRNYLKSNARTTSPETVICVDTETRSEPLADGQVGQRLRFFLGHAIRWRWRAGHRTDREELSFRHPETFWDYAISHLRGRNRVWIWAHNAIFDMTQLRLWELLESKTFEVRFLVAEDHLTWIVLRHQKGTIVIADTTNFWRQSLSKLGSFLGLAKLARPGPDDEDAAWVAYCRRDTEILGQLVCLLVETHRRHDLGIFRPAAGAMAMQAYRHRYMTHPIQVHRDPEATQLEAASYYGGRHECYYWGDVVERSLLGQPGEPPLTGLPRTYVEGSIYQCDVNSLYPSMMAGHIYPTRLQAIYRHLTIQDLDRLVLRQCVTAEVDIHSPAHAYPVRVGERVLWCRGRYRTTLATPELSVALRRGHVAGVGRVCLYDGEEIFNLWVSEMWGLRRRAQESGDLATAMWAKALLVALPGKFAQRVGRWLDQPGRDPPISWGYYTTRDAPGGPLRQYRSLGWHVQGEGRGGYTRNAFVAITAHVTSYARVMMDWYRAKAGKETCLYQADDCLYLTAAGYQQLDGYYGLFSSELGSLRVIATAPHMGIYGVGHVRWGGEAKLQGVSQVHSEVSPGVWSGQEWERLPGLIGRSPDGSVLVRQVTRSIPPRYPGGRVRDDGWVVPYILPNELSKGGEP